MGFSVSFWLCMRCVVHTASSKPRVDTDHLHDRPKGREEKCTLETHLWKKSLRAAWVSVVGHQALARMATCTWQGECMQARLVTCTWQGVRARLVTCTWRGEGVPQRNLGNPGPPANRNVCLGMVLLPPSCLSYSVVSRGEEWVSEAAALGWLS